MELSWLRTLHSALAPPPGIRTLASFYRVPDPDVAPFIGPALMYIRDLDPCNYGECESGPLRSENWAVPLKAIGWLEHSHQFERGDTPEGFMVQLEGLVERPPLSLTYLGMLICSICVAEGLESPGPVWSQENILVPGGGRHLRLTRGNRPLLPGTLLPPSSGIRRRRHGLSSSGNTGVSGGGSHRERRHRASPLLAHHGGVLAGVADERKQIRRIRLTPPCPETREYGAICEKALMSRAGRPPVGGRPALDINALSQMAPYVGIAPPGVSSRCRRSPAERAGLGMLAAARLSADAPHRRPSPSPSTTSSVPSGPERWARSTARRTRAWIARWRSRSFRNTSRRIRSGCGGSSARPSRSRA